MKDPGRMFHLRQGERSPTPPLDSGSGAGMTIKRCSPTPSLDSRLDALAAGSGAGMRVRRGFHGEMVQNSSAKPLRTGVEGSA